MYKLWGYTVDIVKYKFWYAADMVKYINFGVMLQMELC